MASFKKPFGRDFGPKPDRTKKAQQGLKKTPYVSSHSSPGPSPEVKKYRILKTEKGRHKESRFLLEGLKQIKDVLNTTPDIVEKIFIQKGDEFNEFVAELKKNRISHMFLPSQDIEELSDTQARQGVIAVCRFATVKPDWTRARLVTMLDGVQDPGNVGAVFRTSLALGMDAIIAGKGTCEVYNPKVVRSAAGAMMRIPFETGVELISKIQFLRLKGFSIVATSPHAVQKLDQVKLRRKVALVVGNEGAGSVGSVLDLADSVVKIPIGREMESLNVAVAHGILAYHLMALRKD